MRFRIHFHSPVGKRFQRFVRIGTNFQIYLQIFQGCFTTFKLTETSLLPLLSPSPSKSCEPLQNQFDSPLNCHDKSQTPCLLLSGGIAGNLCHYENLKISDQLLVLLRRIDEYYVMLMPACPYHSRCACVLRVLPTIVLVASLLVAQPKQTPNYLSSK